MDIYKPIKIKCFFFALFLVTCASRYIWMCQNILCHVMLCNLVAPGCRSSFVKTDLKWTKEKNKITVSKPGDPAEFALLSMKVCQLGHLCSHKCVLSKTTNYLAPLLSNLYEVMGWSLLSEGGKRKTIRGNPLLIQKIWDIWGFLMQTVHLAALHMYECTFLQRELFFRTSLLLQKC